MYKPVPDHIIRPDYARPENNGKPRKPVDLKGRPLALKNELKGEALGRMRRACAAAREVLEEVLSAVRPGVTTDELDEIAHEGCIKRGGYPSPLGYHGFPKSLCTSLNEVICHGIPSAERVLIDGDIINCDVTIYLEGMHGDCSETVFVGRPSAEARALVEFTYEAMMAGIDAVRPGATLGDVARAIQSHAEGNRFSVVRDFCGHGLGRVFHDAPSVLHYHDRENPLMGMVLRPGMFFTIEPMINAGDWRVKLLSDGWTAVTRDRSLSAQFEHSIGVTETGFEIFTASPAGLHRPPYTA